MTPVAEQVHEHRDTQEYDKEAFGGEKTAATVAAPSNPEPSATKVSRFKADHMPIVRLDRIAL